MSRSAHILKLAERIKAHLPVASVCLLTKEGNGQQLICLDQDGAIRLPSDVRFNPDDDSRSFYCSLNQLPADLQSVFADAEQLIVTPVVHKTGHDYLLLGLADFEAVNSVTNKLMLATLDLLVENDSLVKVNNVKEKKYQEYIREVKTIKEKLLPAENHQIEGLDYATYYRPSIGGGGDHFDVVDLRPSRERAGVTNPPLIWGVGLMDVSGHGPGAAVEVAMLDAILRTYQYKQGTGPADVLNYLNKHYFTREYRGGYTTGILCNYDASTDVFSYASAGHLPVLIKHHEGHVSILESKNGIPIGIERDYQWETETTRLEQGDTIVLYTDGITEAESRSGEQFTFERLQSVLEHSPAGSAEVLMSNFMDAFHQHISNAVEQDDQTLVMVTISS